MNFLRQKNYFVLVAENVDRHDSEFLETGQLSRHPAADENMAMENRPLGIAFTRSLKSDLSLVLLCTRLHYKSQLLYSVLIAMVNKILFLKDHITFT